MRRSVLISVAACLVAGAGCDREARRRPEPPNFIVVSADTLRAQSLGAYGYSRETSPFFDSLAGEGALFLNAIAPSTTTAPSHMSIFTGLYPRNHGVRSGFGDGNRDVVMLARVLREAGYRTAAFSESGFLSLGEQFKDGFDEYRRIHVEGVRGDAGFAEITFWDAAVWLRENQTEPFFLFVHTYQVHSPYKPQGRYADLFENEPTSDPPPLAEIRDRYDREVRFLDDQLRFFVESARKAESERPTVIVILSDHGEEFGEHGNFQHGSNLFDEVLRVPLLFWAPGLIEPRRVETQVSLIDVAPTLLQLAGLPVDPGLDGVSLSPTLLAGSEPPQRTLYAEAASRHKWIGPLTRKPANPYRLAIRSQDRKVIVHRPEKGEPDHTVVYDLASDSAERRPTPLSGTALADAERLADAYLGADAAVALREEAKAAENLSPEMKERMRVLGYVE